MYILRQSVDGQAVEKPSLQQLWNEVTSGGLNQ